MKTGRTKNGPAPNQGWSSTPVAAQPVFDKQDQLDKITSGTVAFSHRTGRETDVMTCSSTSAFAGFRFRER